MADKKTEKWVLYPMPNLPLFSIPWEPLFQTINPPNVDFVSTTAGSSQQIPPRCQCYCNLYYVFCNVFVSIICVDVTKQEL